jgi:hypothetical protein
VRLCYNASTTLLPSDIVMNQETPVDNKAPITFGTTKMFFYSDIYNTRIYFSDNTILLATANIITCFRFAGIHADLSGAFGFNSGGYFNLATSMVFGSKASAYSWEAFHCAIEALSVVYANRPNLVAKHKYYLDMIRWATIDPTIKLTQATACAINTGVLDKNGATKKWPARIFAENSLLLAIGCRLMEMALASLIEAIFVIMGKPDTAIRQCLLALDKWEDMVPVPIQTMLGLVLDINELAVAIPGPYVCKLHNLIAKTWHKNCQSFSV